MPDFHRTIEQIRALLLSSDLTRTERMDELARDFADLAATVNTRLAGCARLLRQGLRSEAILKAKEEPDLLDAVQLLDFPARGEWQELVDLYGLTAPQAIDLESAEFLQAAFTEEDPIQGLLRKHRRLALERAPLLTRIAILRRLAAADPTNSIWTEDLGAYERGRLAEIRREASDAARNKDAPALAALAAELESPGWTAPPPSALTAGVRKALDTFRTGQARRELEEVGRALDDAFAALDVARGRDARERWDSLVEQARLEPSSPIRDRAAPALSWLESCDRGDQIEAEHQDAVAELEAALDDDLDPAEIERCYHAVARFDQGVPPGLDQRCRKRLADIALRSTRRGQAALASVVVSVAAIGVVAWWFLNQQNQAREAHRFAEAINAALDKKDLELARDLDSRLTKGGLSEAAEVAQARARLSTSESKEKARLATFRGHLDAARSAPPSRTPPPGLDAARRLARTDAERQEVDEVQRARLQQLDALVAENDRKLLPVYRETLEALATLDGRSDELTEEELIRGRDEVLARKPSPPESFDLCSDSLRELDAAIAQRSASIARGIELQGRQRALLARVSGSILELPDRPEAYAEAVRAIAEDTELRDRQLTGHFKTVAAEQPAWEAALAWASLCRSFGDEPFDVSSREASSRAARCRTFLQEYPGFPDAARVEDALAHFEGIGRRNSDSGSLRKALGDRLSDGLIENVFTVTYTHVGKEQIFYTKAPLGDNTTKLRYIGDFNLGFKEQIVVPKELKGAKSPQTAFAERLQDRLLTDLQLRGWEGLLFDAAREASADARIDPFMKRLLLLNILEIGSQGSLTFRRAVEPSLRVLQESKSSYPPSLLWIDPTNAAANVKRPGLKALLEKLPPWDELAAREAAERRELAESLTRPAWPVGWLAYDLKARRWQCVAARGASASGSLAVIVAGSPRASWRAIGHAEGGALQLDESDIRSQVQGRLIFLITDGASTSAEAP